VHAFLERINEWGYALSETLQGQLEAGSMAAIAVVFAAGVLTSFTPCVYPMIPVTVTYIGTAAGGKRSRSVSLSSVYVLGMAVVYASLGVITALLGKTFGRFTVNAWVYGGVGLLIVFFAVIMLDVVTLPVPRLFASVQADGVRRGGHLGALMIGIAAGFVAAPCTAPVLGLLLVYVAKTLLFVFAIGLGTLLFIVGTFTGLLTSLPRAGIWMKWIKVFFAVLMFLVGGWFLYKALFMVL